MADKKLLIGAIDDVIAGMAILQHYPERDRTRSDIESAQRHVSAANAKLVEYICQMRKEGK